MVGNFVLIVEKGQRPLRRRIGGSWSFLQGQPLQGEEQGISHQDVELYHVTVLGPPGVQAKTILTLSIKFVMWLLPGLFKVVELFPRVIISPHPFVHLRVFRPVSPGFA